MTLSLASSTYPFPSTCILPLAFVASLDPFAFSGPTPNPSLLSEGVRCIMLQ